MCRGGGVPGRGKRGRPQRSFMDVVTEEKKADHTLWRKQPKQEKQDKAANLNLNLTKSNLTNRRMS